MHKITVITPVYNVRSFIEKCASSLMRQTFKDVEFIFVDDASSDGSVAILESVIAQFPENDVTIIHHSQNRGLPSARKTGFEAASGDYVFNCDGDDYVEETLLEKLYGAVCVSDSDYAYCDFFLTYKNRERYMKCPSFMSAEEALRIGYLSGSAKYNVWNKLIRRSLYEGVEFPVDHRKGGEDMIMFYVLSRAKSVAYVPEALYHYVKFNEDAISEKFSEQRLIDIRYNADYAIRSVMMNCKSDFTHEIAFFKQNVKLPFLITDDYKKYDIWKKWYPESNAFAAKNKVLPSRTRMLQWFAVHDLWFAVWLYYKIVYRLIYRLYYR